LYQKTFIQQLSGNHTTIDISAYNIETATLIDGYYDTGVTRLSLNEHVSGAGDTYTHINIGTTPPIIDCYNSIANNSTIYVTVYYTKTTDTAGSGSYNTLGVPTVHYTTDEQVIGTWIDGKPLYERSYSFTNTRSSFTDYVTLYNIPNIETVVKNTFTALRDLGQNEKLHYTGEGTSRPEHDASYYINVREYNGDIQYRINGYGTQITEMVITTQYTKTTD
jgi:hypothetical protein